MPRHKTPKHDEVFAVLCHFGFYAARQTTHLAQNLGAEGFCAGTKPWGFMPDGFCATGTKPKIHKTANASLVFGVVCPDFRVLCPRRKAHNARTVNDKSLVVVLVSCSRLCATRWQTTTPQAQNAKYLVGPKDLFHMGLVRRHRFSDKR